MKHISERRRALIFRPQVSLFISVRGILAGIVGGIFAGPRWRSVLAAGRRAAAAPAM